MPENEYDDSVRSSIEVVAVAVALQLIFVWKFCEIQRVVSYSFSAIRMYMYVDKRKTNNKTAANSNKNES